MSIGSTAIGVSGVGGLSGIDEIIVLSIASTTVVPSPSLIPTIVPVGIGPTVVFGLPALALEIMLTGIAPTVVFGAHLVSPPQQFITVGGIASTLVFGGPSIATSGATIITIPTLGISTGLGTPNVLEGPFYLDVDPAVTTVYEDLPT